VIQLEVPKHPAFRQPHVKGSSTVVWSSRTSGRWACARGEKTNLLASFGCADGWRDLQVCLFFVCWVSIVGDVVKSLGDVAKSLNDVAKSPDDVAKSLGDVAISLCDVGNFVSDVAISLGDVGNFVSDVAKSLNDVARSPFTLAKSPFAVVIS
jgi:hypothetical protein